MDNEEYEDMRALKYQVTHEIRKCSCSKGFIPLFNYQKKCPLCIPREKLEKMRYVFRIRNRKK